MKILVTGGAGFIGSHLAQALVDRGDRVLVVDDLSTGKRDHVPTGAEFLQLDIGDAPALVRAFDEFRPELVAHLAAQTSVSVSAREPSKDARVNVIGSLHVLECCVASHVARVVFASTGGAIYGEVPANQRATTTWPAGPLSPYGCAKLAVEHYLRAFRHEHGLAFQVLRYANVYGPRQDPHGEAGVVAIFSRRLVEGQPISVFARRERGDEGCVRDYVYVDDVVRANLLAIDGKFSRDIVNVCSGMPTTTLALAQQLGVQLGVTPDIRMADRRMGDLECSVLDPGAEAALLGPPVDLATGLAKTAAWFRRHG